MNKENYLYRKAIPSPIQIKAVPEQALMILVAFRYGC